MTALLTHEVAAAGVKEVMYRKFEQEPLKALKTSDPLPNFSFCASPRVKPRTYARLVKQLLLLKPLARPADARIVKAWDDEIKHGFVTPDADFLPSVMQLNSIYQEIAHEAR
ncbi:MAG TPA: PhnD/SsuA/transferrin family substrate-binding protein, partial [Nitrospirota bacterium]